MPIKFSLILLLGLLSGCSITSKMSQSLSDAMLNQNDPGVVEHGAPAYLLMIDALIENDEDDSDLLLAGAKLYGAYVGAFVKDADRQVVLSNRAYDYAKRGACEELKKLCAVLDKPFSEFAPVAQAAEKAPVLYQLASSWAGRIQAQPGDWRLIADLPKVRLLLERSLELQPDLDDGSPHLYLGVLHSLLPPSLGGKPDVARNHFEQAWALSSQRNLMARVMLAEYHARAIFDQNLHDGTLNEVLAAEITEPGFTLINQIAKQRAAELLASGADYF